VNVCDPTLSIDFTRVCLRAGFAWNVERVSKSTDTQPWEPLLSRTTLLPHVSVARSLTGTRGCRNVIHVRQLSPGKSFSKSLANMSPITALPGSRALKSEISTIKLCSTLLVLQIKAMPIPHRCRMRRSMLPPSHTTLHRRLLASANAPHPLPDRPLSEKS